MIRLFAALELPGDVRAALGAWAARAVGREEAVRLVPVESLHVTLVFLGSQDEAHADAIGAAVLAAARPVGRLAVSGAAWLPPRRPGVLVADLAEIADGPVGEPGLITLHRAAVAALRPWHQPETRTFRPHVTVARVRRRERIGARGVVEPPALEFSAPALVLYRSRTGPGGSAYEPLVRVEL